MKKERLDLFLVEQGLFESRSKAQAVIMAGEVLVDDHRLVVALVGKTHLLYEAFFLINWVVKL